jgi:effector-binding domain-containing protein
MANSKMSRIIYYMVIPVSIILLGSLAMAIEKAKYNVLEKKGRFEIRQYEKQVLAETFVEGDFEDVGNEGFRRLYDYISGKNRNQQSISMTAPVTQENSSVKIAMTAPVSQEKRQNRWRITFMMPAEFSLETLPEPLDQRVRMVEEPGRLMAAVKYSGTWSNKSYEANRERLLEFIKEEGLRQVGTEIWARYDPPFMPWFLRRNEVLIPVEKF